MAFDISVLQLPLLTVGSNNSTVLAWQKFLKSQDLPVGFVDGDFGRQTALATRMYQQKNNLLADGVVGNMTYNVAATQGFISLISNLDGNKLMMYLGFGETEVKDLQRSLNQVAQLPPPLVVDGDFGPRSLKGLAEAYKKRDVRLREELEEALSSATKDKLGSDFTQALDIFNDYGKTLRFRLSGSHWYESFPTSKLISDLRTPFRQKVEAFQKALIDAGCQVIVTATHRPRQRAYLMHYAARIYRRDISPWYVPRMGGVDIDWVHYTNAGSLQAAKDMLDAYGIGGNPVSLNSRHIQRLAIDWNVTWNGTIRIRDGYGRTVSIGSPNNASLNWRMWRIGSSYGVYKLQGDPPHWSVDGY
ncbi:MAG: peptidoglycan-binding domain-containing protein [Nostocaceae cyanobacterium]|nr:peptidoglycan-binding domain-containing protein [Nostocaceae cyanobacterium]